MRDIADYLALRREDDLRVRPGRSRNGGSANAKPFVARVLASAERAGGIGSGHRGSERSSFGRGRAAAFAASRMLNRRSRGVVVKARVVRYPLKGTNLSAHLAYLRRDDVSRDGDQARMFDAAVDDADPRAFAERCEGERHHFRFIVSPQDAAKMADLRAFTRDLVAEMEHDLGTRLDWIAVEHWNTQHPHIHIILRGKTDKGSDLILARDYISNGLRSRAEHLVTLELGTRSDIEIRRDIAAQVEADRWTTLDRALSAEAFRNNGIVDLRKSGLATEDADTRPAMIGRMRKLARLGLAEPIGPSQWRLKETAEATLQAIGERHDIIKRIHRDLKAQNIERSVSEFPLDAEEVGQQILGRLVSRGLDDELKGTAYVIVDGIDGRTHHVRLPDLDATSDAAPGAIVEVRRFEDAAGRQRVAIAVRSDFDLAAQVHAEGATWIDRQLLAREPVALGSDGFGWDVRASSGERIEYLIGEGLARRQGQRVLFVRNLLDTLRERELATAARRLENETGLVHRRSVDGETIAGVYRRRLDLASGRFAMLEDKLGFRLVPWKPSLERHAGRQVFGFIDPRGPLPTFDRGQSIGY